jgi:hypothetical protein
MLTWSSVKSILISHKIIQSALPNISLFISKIVKNTPDEKVTHTSAKTLFVDGDYKQLELLGGKPIVGEQTAPAPSKCRED